MNPIAPGDPPHCEIVRNVGNTCLVRMTRKYDHGNPAPDPYDVHKRQSVLFHSHGGATYTLYQASGGLSATAELVLLITVQTFMLNEILSMTDTDNSVPIWKSVVLIFFLFMSVVLWNPMFVITKTLGQMSGLFCYHLANADLRKNEKLISSESPLIGLMRSFSFYAS